MEDKITLEKDVFKALASDTRVEILKVLSKRRHTQSEIAHYMNMSVPTIKEHLEAMARAGLVKQKDEGRKWKYFELTEKSKCILDPERKKVWIMLGFWIVAAAGTIAVFSKNFFGKAQTTTFGALTAMEAEAPAVMKAEADSVVAEAAPAAQETVVQVAQQFPYVDAIAISILAVITILLLVFLFRSRIFRR